MLTARVQLFVTKTSSMPSNPLESVGPSCSDLDFYVFISFFPAYMNQLLIFFMLFA
jgi:hypothetical protein